MFDDWKAQTNLYIRKHINRKAFQVLAGELDADIAELSDHYTAVLLANGIIDESGSETGLDFDEDDLLEAMLDRFLLNHPSDSERDGLYAGLINEYLMLVEESSEDI